jgi:hypothetical protein
MRSGKVTIVLLLVATLASIAGFHFAYQAGCAGDLKTGTLGNPQSALRYEGLSSGTMLIALLCLTTTPFFAMRGGLLKQVLAATAIFFVLLAVLVVGGIQMEYIGVQKCFPR